MIASLAPNSDFVLLFLQEICADAKNGRRIENALSSLETPPCSRAPGAAFGVSPSDSL
jgi:hypothetical protein